MPRLSANRFVFALLASAALPAFAQAQEPLPMKG